MKSKISSKLEKIKKFDSSNFGLLGNNIFGLPFTIEESEIVVIPVPWEVTVSYRTGTARGPSSMFDASFQVDLYDEDIRDAWKLGIAMNSIPQYWIRENKILREKAKTCIKYLEKGGKSDDAKVKPLYKAINSAGHELNKWMRRESAALLKQGKSVCVLGGEHSVPLGFMQTLAENYPSFSMLHIDAHADLREAYEGFEFSHASIQYNATKIKNIDQFVLLGIRDYSEQEADRIKNSQGRIVALTDRAIKRNLYEGISWKRICERVLKSLSKNVYISFDIDALDPSLCPHTGTPVPGGFEFEQVFYLIDQVVKSGRRIIGCDLCEVAPAPDDDWDSIVGARALYRLVNLMAKSQGKFSR